MRSARTTEIQPPVVDQRDGLKEVSDRQPAVTLRQNAERVQSRPTDTNAAFATISYRQRRRMITGSARTTTMTTTTNSRHWQFLPKTVNEKEKTLLPRKPTRPATARGGSAASIIPTDKATRPHTCRGFREKRVPPVEAFEATVGTAAATTVSVRLVATPRLAFDHRVLEENARRQVEQLAYVDPRQTNLLDAMERVSEASSRNVQQQQQQQQLKQPPHQWDTLAMTGPDEILHTMSRPEFHRTRAQQARRRGDLRLAITHLEELLLLTPQDRVARFQVAVLYDRTGQYEAALLAYRSVHGGNQADSLLNCPRTNEDATQSDERDTRISHEAGTLSARATRRLQRQGGPTSVVLHFHLGNVLMKLHRVRDAIDAYSTAIHHHHHPQSQPISPTQARQSNGDEEVRRASRLLVAIHQQRGAAYRCNGDYEKAAHDYSLVGMLARRGDKDAGLEATTAVASSTQSGSAVDTTTPKDTDATAIAVAGSDGSPVAVWQHRRVMAIAASTLRERSEDECAFLADDLQRQFPLCANLHPGAVAHISKRIVGWSCAPRGTVLFQEREQHTGGGGSDGDAAAVSNAGMVFLIRRGEVTAFKKVVQFMSPTRMTVKMARVDPKEPNQQRVPSYDEKANPEVDTSCTDVLSWEQVLVAAENAPDPEENTDECDHDDKIPSMQTLAGMVTVVELGVWTEGQAPLTQLRKGEACGQQGRFSRKQRSYSIVVTEPCDFLALTWADLAEAERLHRLLNREAMARFFRTVPLFQNLPPLELAALASTATTCKIVGSRVVCTEGQHVNGLIIVRTGELCQLQPSMLARPPNLAITFSLSGSLASVSTNAESDENTHFRVKDNQQVGCHFFTQLEFADDPLHFMRDSGAMHGFLPQDFISTAIHRIQVQQRDRQHHHQQHQQYTKPIGEHTDEEHEHLPIRITPVSLPPNATALPRGAFFSASTAWIPSHHQPRDRDGFQSPSSPKSENQGATREDGQQAVAGISCAKSALVSAESAEIVFLTPRDIINSLSSTSRATLQHNMRELLRERRSRQHGHLPTPRRPPPKLRHTDLEGATPLVAFLKEPSGDDLVKKLEFDSSWRKYKTNLLQTVVDDTENTKPRSLFHRSTRNQTTSDHRPGVAWRR